MRYAAGIATHYAVHVGSAVLVSALRVAVEVAVRARTLRGGR